MLLIRVIAGSIASLALIVAIAFAVKLKRAPFLAKKVEPHYSYSDSALKTIIYSVFFSLATLLKLTIDQVYDPSGQIGKLMFGGDGFGGLIIQSTSIILSGMALTDSLKDNKAMKIVIPLALALVNAIQVTTLKGN